MQVAVLGAGYAGLTLARKLQRTLPDGADLVVVDESDEHVLQHELHRVIRRPSLTDEITVPFEEVLDCEVRRAEVTNVKPGQGAATLNHNESLDYDVGAVCLGAETDDYGLPGVAEHGTPLKRLDHAREIREDYLDVLEAGGRVVVGGAGLSGVQVAGELAAMAAEHRRDGEKAAAVDAVDSDADAADSDAADTDTADADADDHTDADTEIVLLERLDSVAPSFPGHFQAAVRDELEARGVEVRTETAVESADADSLALSTGDDLAYDQFVWTGGIRGPDALDAERPEVRSDLRVTGDTFVVGDAGRVVDVDGRAVPASAQSAIREARVAARNITALVEHRLADDGGFAPTLDRYAFDSPGWLVSVGDGAVAQVGSRVLTGRAALALKTSVGAGYLGSVGAVENAVDLVRQELDLAVEGGEEGDGEGNGSGGGS